MTDPQLETLLVTLNRLADRMGTYTLTGAADWPILVALVGILVGMIGYMWHDLKRTIGHLHTDAGRIERECRAHAEKEDDKIWRAMRDCQKDCCLKDRT